MPSKGPLAFTRALALQLAALFCVFILPAQAIASPPVVKFSAPALNTVASAPFNVVAAVTADSAIGSVTMSVDGTNQQQSMSTLWGVRIGSVTPAALSEGTHQIRVVATDSNNESTTATRDFIVDTTAPTVSINAPTYLQSISGTKQVVAVVKDLNWKNGAALEVDGKLMTSNMSIFYANYYFLDTTNFSNGLHTLKVTGTDKAGNVAAATVDVVFNNDVSAMQAPPHTVTIQAENTPFTSPFRKYYGYASDANAYLEVPVAAGVNATPTASAGAATFTVNVPKRAWYRILGRTRALATTNQLMYVRVDDTTQLRWPVRLSNDWVWGAVQDPGKTANPAKFLLSAGVHTIKVTWGQPSVKFDALVITNDRTYSPAVEEKFDSLGMAWSADRVAFDLYTTKTHQFVGFYDENRYLVVGVRTLGSRAWTYKKTTYQWAGYDSHRYITIGLDKYSVVHVAAGMHADNLVYFRASKANDVTTLTRIACMLCNIAHADEKMTYPSFYTNPAGELLYKYRTGYPQAADVWLNIYNASTKTWSRQTTKPWLSHTAANPVGPYPVDPVRGPNGVYHAVWVYRTAAGVQNNIVLSYARSTNLRDWTKSDGTPLALPITLETGEVIDPRRNGAGLVNGRTLLAITPSGAPVVSYHAFDALGRSQVFVANLKAGNWVFRAVTKLTCANYGIEFNEVRFERDGSASQDYSGCGEVGRVKLNATTFEPIGTYPPAPELTGDLLAGEPEAPDLICGYEGAAVMTQYGRGTTSSAKKYVLRWYTLPTFGKWLKRENCDTPTPIPLRLYKLK